MAAEDPSKSNGGGGPSKPGEDDNKQNPEAPRPKGAPNRFSSYNWHLIGSLLSSYNWAK